MKDKKHRHVTFVEPLTNEPCSSDSNTCKLKRKLKKDYSVRKQNSYFKKIQEHILDKIKKGNTEEAVKYMLDLDISFVNKILSSNNYKIIKWAISNDEINVFNIMIDLLEHKTREDYLNECCIQCVAFLGFLGDYKSKETYDSQNFIEGLKGFLKINMEECKKTFEKYKVALTEQIKKDFQIATDEFERNKTK
jgi:hypothetical protein